MKSYLYIYERSDVIMSYCIKIPIVDMPVVQDRLGYLFDICHDLYNDCVADIYRKLEYLDSISDFKESNDRIKEIFKLLEDADADEVKVLNKEKASLYKIINKYRKDNGISGDYATVQTKIVVPIKQSNPKYSIIPSPFYTSLSKDIAKSVEKYLYDNGKQIYFKSRRKGTTVTNLSGSRIRSEKSNNFNAIIFGYEHSQKMFYIKIAGMKVKDKKSGKNKDFIIPLNVYNNSSGSTNYILKNLAYAFDIPFVPKTKSELNQFLNELNQKMVENNYKYLTFPKIGPCSIVFERIRGVNRYYLTINLDGEPFKKYGLNAVSDARNNVVGIDLGTQTIALSFRDKNGKVFKTDLFEFVENVDNDYIKKIEDVNRKMERSRRENNPQNFNEDGTISKGKKQWNCSQNYKDLKNKNAQLYRNIHEYSKVSHAELVKYILNFAHNVVVEPMSYPALAKRAKETTYKTVEIDGQEVQRANKKARFGKSVLKKSPASFVNMLKQGVAEVGGRCVEVDKFNTKASQYNHQLDDYIKKNLGTRWNTDLYYMGEEVKIQRDLYSAFLLSNVGIETKIINKSMCDIGFDDFVLLHNKCIEELKGTSSQALRNILK